jgi:DNA-binding NtrC family response regulator
MSKAPWRHMLYVSRTPDASVQDLLIERGWSLSTVESLHDAQRLLAKEPATVGLFDFTGYAAPQIAAFEAIFAGAHTGWIAAVSAEMLNEHLVSRLIRLYFFDFVTLPCQAQRIVDVAGHAHGMIVLEKAETSPERAEPSEMIGTCAAMQAMFDQMQRFAGTDAPVLIYGESGTGKELTAAAIHARSIRRKGPFVALNCGAIPRELVQSVLFGYERGAFTGAQQQKIGHVEAAHGGTLFLDELGDLPLESQVSLLRFLQERKIQRVGSHVDVPVDVRIVSATHMNLEDAVSAGTFRSDLYHRLCVLRLVVPPLRERGKDIEILAHHTLERFRTDSRRRIRGFSDEAIRAMHSYSWPGNIRELINRVRRAIVMTEGRVITPADLELGHYADEPTCTLDFAREAIERQTIKNALLRHHNRLNDTARALGVSRATLYRLMQAHGLGSPGASAAIGE